MGPHGQNALSLQFCGDWEALVDLEALRHSPEAQFTICQVDGAHRVCCDAASLTGQKCKVCVAACAGTSSDAFWSLLC